jgi:class 3 adenylate cyclase
MQLLKTLIHNFKQKSFGIGRAYYPLRILGYAYGILLLVLQGNSSGFDSNMYMLIGVFLVYPHLCFLFYKFSGSSRFVELSFLIIDTFWAGMFIGIMSFAVFPTIMYIVMTWTGNMGVRGVRQCLYGIIATIVGIGVSTFFKPLTFEPNSSLLIELICCGLVTIYALYFGYTAYVSTVYQKKLRKEIEIEKKHSEALLLNILPYETANELKSKGYVDAQTYRLVTVMFTDFKDFTKVSELMSPQELVVEIDKIYREFDRIIGVYGIEKIKTIGDAYMCAGGLPKSNHTHASDVVAAAIDIVAFIRQEIEMRKSLNLPYFDIRIGIHTGPLVAGVVGIKKFSYDIWGNAVNIASRMESSGEAGKINISEDTYHLVKDRFVCRHRGKITAKNKGEVDMYFVESAIPTADTVL